MDDPHIRPLDGLQIVEGPGGVPVARSPDETFDFGGMPRSMLRAFLDALGRGCSLGELIQRLDGHIDSATVTAIVEAYDGLMLHLEVRPTQDRAAGTTVVVGNATLAEAIARHLRRTGVEVELVPVASLAGTTDIGDVIRAAGADPVPLPGALVEVDAITLASRLEGADLVIIAFERVAYGRLPVAVEAAGRAGVPLLAAVPHPGRVVVGPVWAQGHGTACPRCVAAATVLGSDPAAWPVADRLRAAVLSDSAGAEILIGLAADEILEAHASLVNSRPDRLPVAAAIDCGADGSRSDLVVRPGPDCPHCGPGSEAAYGPQDGADSLTVAIAARQAAAVERRATGPAGPTAVRSVGVIGGGTAGYLTALALRRRFPSIEVTLLESSQIGVIGVGEATTPRLVQFLHGSEGLGLDIVELHERVRPVWKLGIYYDWAPPGAAPFAWPFQYGDIGAAVHHGHSLDDHCLGASLMHAARTPLVDLGDGDVLSLLREVPFAYHLDNASFVAWLRDVGARAGVHRIEATVDRVERNHDGTEVAEIVTDDGRRMHFDLYVDCSGFRSLLLEGALDSNWLPYDDSLFCDAAIVTETPHGGEVRPYTGAATMEAGWCWRIAFEAADHRGYVFSTRHLDPEAAADELRAREPKMTDPWIAHFRSGRHADWWRGNVVALGNAYGFVEPLASTALHLLVAGIEQLSSALMSDPGPVAKAALSDEMGRAWDDVRCWLATQYRFNRRLDTPFWQECRASVALHDGERRVARFRERAPLTATGPQGTGYFADDYSYDIVLAGQRVEAAWTDPGRSLEDWQAISAQRQAIAARSLTHDQAMAHVRRHPDVLEALAADPDGWLQRGAY